MTMSATLQTDDLLDIDQIWELYRLTGDMYYRNVLVAHYHGLVEPTAEHVRRKLPAMVELDDLVSAGSFGLMAAVESYDRSRGVRFETYCVHRIRGAILDELRQSDWVPRSARKRVQKLAKATELLQARLGRRPNVVELAEELAMDAAEVERFIDSAPAPRLSSLDDVSDHRQEGQPMSPLDRLAAHNTPEPSHKARRRDLIRHLTRGLTRTEKLILVLYHCEELTMKEIGVTLGLSESRVSQMHSNLLARLRAEVTRHRATFNSGEDF
jgi:RNA polymerase sigma factor for flagellar operon FliA